MDEASLLDPVPDRSLRIVARDEVDAEADEVGDVEAPLHLADDLLGRRGARLEREVSRPHGRAAAHAAPRAARRPRADLARRIRVAQEVADDAVLERHVAARGQALAVEGTRSEAARPAAVVD